MKGNTHTRFCSAGSISYRRVVVATWRLSLTELPRQRERLGRLPPLLGKGNPSQQVGSENQKLEFPAFRAGSMSN
jgi:hypothetical protein